MKHISKIVLLTGLLSTLFLTVSPVHAAGTFSISPTSGNYLRSCNQSVDIDIDVESGTTNAADVIITYDTTKIDIIDALPGIPGVQIRPGNAFENYAGNAVNTTTGEIKLVGFSSTSTLSAKATFASILFKSKALTTSGGFTITFTGANPYNTLDSNIADSTTSFDMLSGVSNASYTFSAGSCETDITPPAITFVSPKNLANNVLPNAPIIIKVEDSGVGVSLPSVIITVNGVQYTATSPELSVTGTPASYTFTLSPSTPLPTNSVSVISVLAEDTAGNQKTSNISINSGYTCPTTKEIRYVNCSVRPTPEPTKQLDSTSPSIELLSEKTLSTTKPYTLTLRASDNEGVLPESLVITLGNKRFTLAGNPTTITVSGDKRSYIFSLPLSVAELEVSDSGDLAGSVQITDFSGNTRIEKILLHVEGKVPAKGDTITKSSPIELLSFLAIPLCLYLLFIFLLSMQPTIAEVFDSKGRRIRFPRGYIVHHDGTKKKLYGSIFGKLHGRMPLEATTLIVQKYGYATTSTAFATTVKREHKKVTLPSL